MPTVIATGTQGGTTGTPCDRQPVHIPGTVQPHGMPPVPPPVPVDREQLERALPNLAANARDAMRNQLDHAFEPFSSTRDAGQGTGLGLARVYGFARQSGGTVLIDGQPGDGVRVRLAMPAAAREPDPVPLAGSA